MPKAGEVIRLVIVEDHVLVREGLIEILQTYEDLEVVGAAGDSGTAVAVVAEQKPDTVLLDVEIPGDEVTTTVGRIHDVSPGTKILILPTQTKAVSCFSSRGRASQPSRTAAQPRFLRGNGMYLNSSRLE